MLFYHPRCTVHHQLGDAEDTGSFLLPSQNLNASYLGEFSTLNSRIRPLLDNTGSLAKKNATGIYSQESQFRATSREPFVSLAAAFRQQDYTPLAHSAAIMRISNGTPESEEISSTARSLDIPRAFSYSSPLHGVLPRFLQTI